MMYESRSLTVERALCIAHVLYEGVYGLAPERHNSGAGCVSPDPLS